MFPNLVCKLCIFNNVPFDTHQLSYTCKRCGIGGEGRPSYKQTLYEYSLSICKE